MDTVKKKPGPKSKAAKTQEALDVALAKAGEHLEPEQAEAVQGAGAEGTALPGDVELAPLAQEHTEPTHVITIELPDYLRDCAIVLDNLLQCPADVRGRIQSELGCQFDLGAGQVRARDGRVFAVRHDEAAHTLELISA